MANRPPSVALPESDQELLDCLADGPKSLIALAKSMRIDVLAEGVETEAQIEFLSKEGCNLIQGFLFSHPKSAFEIPEIASYWVRSANWR